MSSPRSWSWLLALRLRSQSSLASWRQSRARTALAREQRRTVLLERALDSSLLRQKELEQEVLQQEHRLQEMADSRTWRELELPTPHERQSLPPANQPTHLELLARRE